MAKFVTIGERIHCISPVIRKAMEELSKENEGIVTKLYQAAAEQAQANQQNSQKDDEIIVEDK